VKEVFDEAFRDEVGRHFEIVDGDQAGVELGDCVGWKGSAPHGGVYP
jgi:hypothetical protein